MDDKTQAAPTIRERVAAGAAWLDQHRPGWPLRIDLITLDVRYPEYCVLGQEFDDFDDRPHALLDLYVAEVHGFYVQPWRGRNLADVMDEYRVLTREWRALIEARRARAAAGEQPCCPCQGPVCEPGCTCTEPTCPKTEAEVLDD